MKFRANKHTQTHKIASIKYVIIFLFPKGVKANYSHRRHMQI